MTSSMARNTITIGDDGPFRLTGLTLKRDGLPDVLLEELAPTWQLILSKDDSVVASGSMSEYSPGDYEGNVPKASTALLANRAKYRLVAVVEYLGKQYSVPLEVTTVKGSVPTP